MKRIKRILFLTLVAAMTAIMILGTPIHSAAEDGKKTYIEDLVVAVGSNYTEAKRKLDEMSNKANKKYYPLNDDVSLNELSSGKGDYVLLGYSTTTNKQDAITDVAMMNMLGAFDFDKEYSKILQEQKDEIHLKVQAMMSAFELFADNVEEAQDEETDSIALFSYEILDKFYNDDIIDSDTGKPVTVAKMITNYEDYSDEQFDNMFMQMSGLAYVVIQKYVFMGCIENWVDSMKDVPENANYTAKDYDKAKVILALMPEFQENIAEYKKGGVSYNSSKADIQNYLNNLSSDEDKQLFIKYSSVEAAMREVKINDTTTLFDLFMQDTNSETVVKSLLPIAYCIDDDYSCLLGSTDLAEFFYIGYTSGKSIAEAKEQINTSQITEGSVYAGVDRSVFDADGIAVTSSAGKAMNSTNQTLHDEYKETKDDLVSIRLAFYTAGLACLLAGIYLCYYGATTISIAKGIMVNVIVKNPTLLSRFCTFMTTTAAGGYVTIAIGVLLIAIFCVLLTLYIVKTVRRIKQEKQLRKIPRIMVDSVIDSDGKRNLTYYYCVKDTDGNCVDVNCADVQYEDQQWNAIYYTKDASAGNPLTTENIKITHYNSDVYQTDVFMPVHLFGETTPYNINSYNGSKEIIETYFGFSRDTTPKEDETIEKTLPGATSIVNGTTALWFFGGGLFGAGVALGVISLVKNKKKKTENNA